MAQNGLCLIITGPSASGKTSAADRVRAIHPDAVRMVTTTSRAPREKETHGVDYNFVTEDEFKAMIARGEFLEYAHTYGNYYGSSKITLQQLREKHAVVLIVIDVQGMKAYKENVEGARAIYLQSPRDQLRARLALRPKTTDEDVERRLSQADEEDKSAWKCDVVMPSFDGQMHTHIVPSILQHIARWTRGPSITHG